MYFLMFSHVYSHYRHILIYPFSCLKSTCQGSLLLLLCCVFLCLETFSGEVYELRELSAVYLFNDIMISGHES